MLEGLARLNDWSLLGLRVLTGSFLIHETIDNIISRARMDEFVQFLTQFGFPMPAVMAPISIAVQFVSGALLIAGWQTRWAGLLVATNFVVAVVMVHWDEPFRGWWPAIVLVFLGAHFATSGSGRFGLDSWLKSRRETGDTV